MSFPILGLHHVTATVNEAQPDLDFATGALGLRLIKKTVNFDNHHVFHFYYGDERGTPGTIWTTFPYAGRGVRVGTKGAGQVTATSFSVPIGSLEFWKSKLTEHGVVVEESAPRFDEEVVLVADPSGVVIELVASGGDPRTGWTKGGVPSDVAVRGLHSLSLTVGSPDETVRFMTDLLGFETTNETEQRIRLTVNGEGPGKMVDVVHDGEAAAVNGLGTVHHVAFAIATSNDQRRLREELIRRAIKVTEVLDRQYFQSIYFHEPGGVLFEAATVGPGFTVDEPLECLGADLKLPPWEEANRAHIEAALPPVVRR
jgi:glyoxalase family protein